MKKILFILNYRAGTNLWTYCNGKRGAQLTTIKEKKKKNYVQFINPDVPEPGYVIKGNFIGTKDSYWLPTNPKQMCPSENYWGSNVDDVIHKIESSHESFSYFSWYTNMGNWWGEVDSHTQIPEPYGIDTPVKFAARDLLSLPGNQEDWKFVYITRDGRNQLESLRNFSGGIEEEYHKKDPENYFQILSKTYRNKARLAIDCNNRLDNFMLVKFEDLISDCVGEIKKVYDFIELPLDTEFVRRAYNRTISSGKRKRHSSFKDKKFNDRWRSWNEWEINTFKEIAGKELLELGYTWD